MVNNQLKEGSLVPLFDSRYRTKRPIYGLYNARRYLPQKVETLLDDVKRNLPVRIQELESQHA